MKDMKNSWKKGSKILILGLIISLTIFNGETSYQANNYRNQDFIYYYSEALKPGMSFKWRIVKFNVVGFSLSYSLREGSLLEVETLDGIDSINVDDFKTYNLSELFKLKIDDLEVPIVSSFTNKVGFFEDQWVYDTRPTVTADYIVYFDLHLLFASRIVFENVTTINRFEFGDIIPSSWIITRLGEDVLIDEGTTNYTVEISTGIVKKCFIEREWNFPDGQHFLAEIEYELIDDGGILNNGRIFGLLTIPELELIAVIMILSTFSALIVSRRFKDNKISKSRQLTNIEFKNQKISHNTSKREKGLISTDKHLEKIEEILNDDYEKN